MSEKYKLNVRKKLSDLGNNGMMMLIVLVCPQILKEAELLKVSKCAKLTEGIFRETLPNTKEHYVPDSPSFWTHATLAYAHIQLVSTAAVL